MNKILSAVVCLLVISSSAKAFQNAHAGLTFNGPYPWIDVTDPAYGAKCDGRTNDTLAIQSALKAANNGSGATVRFPLGVCLFTNLVLDNYNNVNLEGPTFPGLGVTRGAVLQSTAGSSVAAISARGIRNVQFRNLTFYNANPAQTGPMVDGSMGSNQSAYVTFDHVYFAGISGSANIAAYIKMDQAVVWQVLYSIFASGAAVYIQGAANNTSFTTSCNVTGNMFNAGLSDLTNVTAIQNLVSACGVIDNYFEIGNGGGLIPGNYTAGSWTGSSTVSGIHWIGNYFVDAGPKNTQTYLTFPDGCSGIEVLATTFGPNSNNSNGFKFGNNCSAVVEGVGATNGATLGTVFTVGNGVTMQIGAGTYGNFSSFLSGVPASGYVTDSTGATTFYNSLTVSGNGGTGWLRMPPGSASMPAYSFSGDAQTGWWSRGPGYKGLAVYSAAGVPLMQIGDNTTKKVGFHQSAVVGFSSSGDATQGAMDNGISRNGASELAVGNGTQGDTSGQVDLTTIKITATAFAYLGSSPNGTLKYCNDCTVSNPCAGGGTGAIAKRLNSAWVCN